MNTHLAIQLALRSKLLSLSVCTTGSVTLAATTTGYSRTTGSFVTDGFAVGMEVLPAGFTANLRATITSVLALAITVNRTLTAEAAGAGRSLTVGLPGTRVWENAEPEDAAGAPASIVQGSPYFKEQYLPGPAARATLGSGGEFEWLPLYVPHIYVPSNGGANAARKYTDALLSHFKPETTMAVGTDTLRVKSKPAAPFSGQLLQGDPGFAVVPVTIPLEIRTLNT